MLILEGVEVIFRSFKIFIDGYIFFHFMRMMHFFIAFKTAKMKAYLIKMSVLNYFVIGYAFIIGVLTFYQSISLVVYYIFLFFLENDQAEDKGVYTMLEFEREILGPIIDAFTVFGILYLLYSLGIKKVKAEATMKMGFESFRSSRSQFNKRPGGAEFDENFSYNSNGMQINEEGQADFNFDRDSSYSKFGNPNDPY